MVYSAAMKTHLLIAAIAVLVAACSGSDETPQNIVPIDGLVTLSDQFSSDFELVDKTGATKRDEDYAGKIMLVYFGFTHCPDVCPIDIQVISAALNELGDEASEVAPVFISVDPERDTPEAMGNYTAFDDRLIGLTGSVEAAKAARDSFKVFAQKQELPDSALGYTVNHSRFFYVTDRSGRPRYALTGGGSPEDLANLLRRAIREFSAG